MIVPSVSEDENTDRQVIDYESVEELSGKLKKQTEEEKLMHSVVENDENLIKDGKLIADTINQGIGSLTPELIYENIVKDYKLAKKLYGDVIIKELTNYNPNYVEKNIKVPEFKREIKKNIEQNIEKLKKDGLIDSNGSITEKGFKLSAIILYVEELDHLIPKGFGEKENKKTTLYGDKKDYKTFKKDRYRDLAIKQSVKVALRRGHVEIEKTDLKAYDRESKGKISVIYGLDASGSMNGEKLKIAKKAGIALAFKAIQERNKVGIIVFGSEIKDFVPPVNDFMFLLNKLNQIRAGMETDISKVILKSIELFPKQETKHLVLLTDAIPTKGLNPEEETIKAVSEARNSGITISLIGINLDEKGIELGKKITEIGNGRLYKVKNLEEMDRLILEDYYQLKK